MWMGGMQGYVVVGLDSSVQAFSVQRSAFSVRAGRAGLGSEAFLGRTLDGVCKASVAGNF